MYLFCTDKQASETPGMDRDLRTRARMTQVATAAAQHCPDLFHQICTSLEKRQSRGDGTVQEPMVQGSIGLCATSLTQFLRVSCKVDCAGNFRADWDHLVSELAQDVLKHITEKASHL